MGDILACFKAYDVRGIVPDELNDDVAYAIGVAFAESTGAKSVCVGHDIRLSGPSLSTALAQGLSESGCTVDDLGLVGTEMVYYATAKHGYDGGIMITASHNPPKYNGMKMVRQESRPISGDSGLKVIEKRAGELLGSTRKSGPDPSRKVDVYEGFIQHLLQFDKDNLIKPLKVLASAGNGAAGVAMDKLIPHMPVDVTKLMFEPDGSFPNGVPNPILPESRKPVEDAMSRTKFDFGVAWDGDYDRGFFFDETGQFIEGYYIVGLLAKAILADNPGATVIYDPRLTWNTLDVVREAGGKAVMCKSGHAFIKEKMRAENAIYGGEMSAHHYFRDHWYCDSGLIPYMLVAKLVSSTGQTLGELVGDMVARYPCSGEINSTVEDVKSVIDRIERDYAPGATIDKTDGISLEFSDWRFNLRGSNTEPVIRLNVESRGDRRLVEDKTAELLQKIRT
jgi:phosphomannomutase